MKLATYESDGAAKVGAIDDAGSRIFDLGGAAKRAGVDASLFASMLNLIDADDAGLDVARTLLDRRGDEADLWSSLRGTTLLAPLPEPRQMRDGMSFATHIRQSGRGARAMQAMQVGGVGAFDRVMAEPLPELAAVYRKIPIYYITNRQTVVGPDTIVRWPRYSKVMDYELEIAAITKRTRANIRAADAGGHIFGYTILNDFSARDRQFLEMEGRLGPAKGKSFDGSNAMGPWIVTADELGDPETLNVEVRVNGETRATSDTSGMLFSFAEFIADAAQDETIRAGEVFGSGTVGNCCGLEIGRFLKGGDEVALHVDRIGVLRNTIVAQN